MTMLYLRYAAQRELPDVLTVLLRPKQHAKMKYAYI